MTAGPRVSDPQLTSMIAQRNSDTGAGKCMYVVLLRGEKRGDSILVEDVLLDLRDARAAIASLRAQIAEMESESAEDQLTLDLQRDAYRRAADRWRAARGATAPTDPYPDLSDLCLWTLTEWDKVRAQNERLREALDEAYSHGFKDGRDYEAMSTEEALTSGVAEMERRRTDLLNRLRALTSTDTGETP